MPEPEAVPPRYVTPAELDQLQRAWQADPRFFRWMMGGSRHEDLPLELQNVVVTRDGLPPAPDDTLVDIPATPGPAVHYLEPEIARDPERY